MRRTALFGALLFSGAVLAAKPALKTEQDKTVYALGVEIGRSIAPFQLSQKELKLVERGIHDQLFGKPALDPNDYRKQVGQLAHSRQQKTNTAFLQKMAATKGARKLPSGVIVITEKKGTGASPKATDTVKVNYKGTLISGTEFDSSYKRHKPATFALNQVVSCWTDGIQKMKVGGKAKLVCPPDTAYGPRGRPGIPPNSVLVFQVELLDIVQGSSK